MNSFIRELGQKMRKRPGPSTMGYLTAKSQYRFHTPRDDRLETKQGRVLLTEAISISGNGVDLLGLDIVDEK